MKLVKISVEVHCTDYNPEDDIRYRLYGNGDLLTERKWRWTTNTFIEEEIWVNIHEEQTSTISIEPILLTGQITDFKMTNFNVITDRYKMVDSTAHCITFIVA